MINSKTLEALAEIAEIVTSTRRISLTICGDNYVIRDLRNKQIVSSGDVYVARQCARRYKESHEHSKILMSEREEFRG